MEKVGLAPCVGPSRGSQSSGKLLFFHRHPFGLDALFSLDF
jgi:hypothetical protein